MNELNILHANPQTLARVGLKRVLHKGGGIGRIEEAASFDELHKKLRSKRYDLVIIDHDHQFSFGLNDIQRVQQQAPEARVLVVVSSAEQPEVLRVLESGINGCVTRVCSEDEMISAVFSIARGEKFFCNKMIDVVLQKHLDHTEGIEEDCEATSLSPREVDVTRLIAEGYTNKEIAGKLFLSVHTVQTHRKNIMRKLGLRSSSELVRYAISIGIIQPQ